MRRSSKTSEGCRIRNFMAQGSVQTCAISFTVLAMRQVWKRESGRRYKGVMHGGLQQETEQTYEKNLSETDE